MGYYITVYLPGKTKSFNIRDYHQLQWNTGEVWSTLVNFDPRVEWVKLFVNLSNDSMHITRVLR
jgi:hypothetical protein